MDDFISLNCPACGGKLEIGENTSVLKCQHCGRDHIVRRQDGAVTLESFARCPKCDRNDRAEKVEAIYKYKTGSSLLNSLLEPPSLNDLKKPLLKSIPPYNPPPKPDLLENPEKETAPILSLGYIMFAFSLLFFIGAIAADSSSFFVIFLSLFILFGLLLIFFGKKQESKIELEYAKTISKIKHKNEILIQNWKDKVSTYKQNYHEESTRIKKENQQIIKFFNLKKKYKVQCMELWKQLYYCHRDDTIYLPGKGDYVQVEKMDDYLLKNISANYENLPSPS